MEEIESDSKKDDIPEIQIKKLIKKIGKLSIYKKIKIIGRKLHYCNEDVIYFYIYINKNTEINPFLVDVKLAVEIILDKVPFIRILSDFVLPTLHDNRNIFFCLTNQHEYKFNYNNIDRLEYTLKDIISFGISNFLYCLKENLQIKALIYYGEYELNRIYNINDFLENDKILKFYRINQIISNNGIQERFIILTQFYFLVFQPDENDNSFAKLIEIKRLKDIKFEFKFGFNNKLKRKTLIMNIKKIIKNDLDSSYELTLIDKNDTENKKTEEKIDDEYYMFEEEIEKKQKEIDFSKFSFIIYNYRPLFNHRTDFSKRKDLSEYDKLIEYNEKLFNYYYDKEKDNFTKKRLEFFLVNINFFCSEMMGEAKEKDATFYLNKMREYLIKGNND